MVSLILDLDESRSDRDDLQTYDTVGPTSKITGPNIALSMSCAPDHSASDIPSAVQSWISAKFPAKKVSLSFPFRFD
jgi:hypothetical protein